MMPDPMIQARVNAAQPFDSWPDPLPLNDELLPVLPLLPDMLPRQLAPWVQDIAERMNCPIDLVAIPVMIAAGSLIGRRVGIRPQQLTDWLEVGNLWGAVVASPGHLKSPAAAEALKPIKRLEAKVAEANAKAQEHFKLTEALHKVERREVEGEVKKRLKEGSKDAAFAAMAAAAEPQARQERRYMTNDATAEKLGRYAPPTLSAFWCIVMSC